MDRLSVERTIDRPSRAPIRLPHGADSRSPAPAAPAPVFGDRVTLHEDALGAFDLRAATERSLELVKFGEAAQDDVDRALPVLDVVIADLGKHATLGRFFDEAGVGGAVASTLRWAQEAADRGDYADALEWVRTIEAIGDQLPPSYRTHRQAWRSALAQNAAK